MAIKVFRGTDTNAPKLTGAAGSMTDVLLGCLVNGYGSSFATGTITSNGTNVSNNDTVTVDDVTYTFKTALTPAANEVLIGASAAASLTNLVAAINLYGTSGTTYGASTKTPTAAWASLVTATVVTIQARRGGTTGNSVGIAKSAATLTVSGATLAGASGSDTTTSAGWSNPYNGNGGQRVFKGGSGVQHFYHVDDATPSTTALGKEAQYRGSETASAFQTGGGFFPTTAQIALGSGLVMRKSVAADNTGRGWIIICDDRTVYGFILSGDTANVYTPFVFGEIYALLASGTDSYRSRVAGRTAVNSNANTDAVWRVVTVAGSSAGHYMPRSYSASGTAIAPCLTLDNGLCGASSGLLNGATSGVDPVTGAIILLPLRVMESVSLWWGTRGRLRGAFGSVQSPGTFGDGDLVTGSGAYAGRSFLAVALVASNSVNNNVILFDITGPWETN